MSPLQTIILGIIQGLTEFLPISSSGHLVVIPSLLGWGPFPQEDVFVFDVLVQVATLAAVFVYFWHDLWEIGRAFFSGLIKRQPFETRSSRLGWYIILATIPASLIGLLIKDQIEAAFSSPSAVALFLIGTAALLVIGERLGTRQRSYQSFTWRDALQMGLFQVLALFPGISRSGSTIVGGMLRDLDRPAAARFSFLMSVPVMLAAGLLAVIDLLRMPHLGELLPSYALGFLAAAVVGYLSIRWLLGYLAKSSLYVFAGYCAGLAALTLLVSALM